MATEVNDELRLVLSKRQLKAGLALGLLAGLGYALKSVETMRLSTYYPAPAGVYKKIITTRETVLARDGGGVGIGTSAPPSTALVVAGPIAARNGLNPQTVALQPYNTSIQSSAGHLKLNPTDNNVAIGGGEWINPQSRLEVWAASSSNATSALNVRHPTGQSMLFVRDDANVGIGTTAVGPAPNGTNGTLNVNDVYLRNPGRWLSQGAPLGALSFYETGSVNRNRTVNIGAHAFCALNMIHHPHENQACTCWVYPTGGLWRLVVEVDESVPISVCGCKAVCLQ